MPGDPRSIGGACDVHALEGEELEELLVAAVVSGANLLPFGRSTAFTSFEPPAAVRLLEGVGAQAHPGLGTANEKVTIWWVRARGWCTGLPQA